MDLNPEKLGSKASCDVFRRVEPNQGLDLLLAEHDSK